MGCSGGHRSGTRRRPSRGRSGGGTGLGVVPVTAAAGRSPAGGSSRGPSTGTLTCGASPRCATTGWLPSAPVATPAETGSRFDATPSAARASSLRDHGAASISGPGPAGPDRSASSSEPMPSSGRPICPSSSARAASGSAEPGGVRIPARMAPADPPRNAYDYPVSVTVRSRIRPSRFRRPAPAPPWAGRRCP